MLYRIQYLFTTFFQYLTIPFFNISQHEINLCWVSGNKDEAQSETPGQQLDHVEVQAPDREPLQRGHQESRPAQRLRARTVHVQGTITSSIAKFILGSGTFAK